MRYQDTNVLLKKAEAEIVESMNIHPESVSAPRSSQIAAPLGIHNTPAEPEPKPNLIPEQQKVVDLILQGHNVFYTGSAICGKSTILKAFVKQLRLQKKHNFAGWTPDSLKKPLDELMAKAHGKKVFERFDIVDVLVIDEISIVGNLLFKRLNHIMKASRSSRHKGRLFGSVQIIVTGDFY
ncbi:hypothetical protein BDV95DRAFT_605413 [Massariosphaeria phaeospora]|uniref:ATP-dependent DNA helicase n=1 Tax=Massariosphaeria phaeospora TaxID=100035 RepID=A0A7C8M7K1_9PLEO|nr:hypothetical protein BDV95DRAFT_605413 [Massariosphaeria phaeospora]